MKNDKNAKDAAPKPAPATPSSAKHPTTKTPAPKPPITHAADIEGRGWGSGNGDELVITLGTGFGSVLFVDGHRIHLELGHHPFRNGKTYEDELGIKALDKKGKRKWNKHLREAIDELARTFNFDRLYIGGGNAAEIDFKLPPNVKIISNTDGLLSGIKLWQDHTHDQAHDAASPKS